jgi:SAM-dependent methyltransferase
LDAIGDADAYLGGDGVVLSQHQAALTVLDAKLSSPDHGSVDWLDLACGRGQILASLDISLPDGARSRIRYAAYDLDRKFVAETVDRATRLGFGAVAGHVGELAAIGSLLPSEAGFDFITLMSALHETPPRQVAALLAQCLLRLKSEGSLYLYDFESLPGAERELGAVTWAATHMAEIFAAMLSGFGVVQYEPIVHPWAHRSRSGWSLLVERRHLNLSTIELNAGLQLAISKGDNQVHTIVEQRLEVCRATLDSLTRTGADTAAERDERIGYLFEYWALNRAIAGWS